MVRVYANSITRIPVRATMRFGSNYSSGYPPPRTVTPLAGFSASSTAPIGSIDRLRLADTINFEAAPDPPRGPVFFHVRLSPPNPSFNWAPVERFFTFNFEASGTLQMIMLRIDDQFRAKRTTSFVEINKGSRRN